MSRHKKHNDSQMTKKQQYIGLTDEQVLQSRQLHGNNILTPPEREPLWRKFLDKFRDPLIIILLVAGTLSIGISFYEYFGLHEGKDVFFEPVGIFVAILLATGLAFLFEYKADKEFSLLNQVNDDEHVQVYRNDEWQQIARRDVVVGDIVRLETGAEIPADGTLLQSTSLMVDESSLTGEPIAEKGCTEDVEADKPDDATTYPKDMVLRGTKVMEGHGVFCVERVGDATESGKVYTAAQIDDSVKTPLNEQLDQLGFFISKASYAIATLVIIARIADYLITEPFSFVAFIAYVLQTIMIAVTLIVVAVPEGLPMAVTLSLAYSMRRMLKTNNLVRKMHACETMGATTVICTDKTGTLTQNKMTVAEMLLLGKLSLYNNIAVNSTAELSTDGVIGNPTEGALLQWVRQQGEDYQSLRQQAAIIDQIPFNTERKYMMTTVASNGKDATYLKGAPEIVMSKCEIDEETKQICSNKLTEWQHRAMRTLAFACDGKMQAIVAISDPVRQDVPAAVEECLKAGIDIKIVTGDTIGTAMEIAREVGIIDTDNTLDDKQDADNPWVITGPELSELSDEELRKRVKSLKVIARARPMDKKRLVEALQARGEVVAVTGDGTNDAPALKAAHVGLSMGDGTAVAKEASDITIIDNSFASIGRAVMWGRSLYRNIQRFILFQLTVNVVACLIVLVGAIFDTQSPLTVTQMLWVNLIMDTFAAMALASLPPSESVMKERPRDRRRFIISRPMKSFILGVGLAMTAILLVFFFWFESTPGQNITGEPLAKNSGFSRYELSVFFTIFVMLQFWNLFNAKAFLTGKSAFSGLSSCRGFLLIVILIFLGQIGIITFGGQMFNVEQIAPLHWLYIITGTSAILIVGEVARAIKVSFRRQL